MNIRFLLSLPALLVASTIYAHPMGNFSINHYSALQLEEGGIRVHYIIDMAEIPTYQEMQNLDENRDMQIGSQESTRFAAAKGRDFQKNLVCVLNRKPVSLQLIHSDLRVAPGAGGLPTLVITNDYFASWKEEFLPGRNSIEYSDLNFDERIGWKEIVLRRNGRIPIARASSSYGDRSKELTEYPSDPTVSPPQETQAVFAFVRPASQDFGPVYRGQGRPRHEGEGQGRALQESEREGQTLDQQEIPKKKVPISRGDTFTKLISANELTGEMIFFSLLIAFALGAMHALSPGHGKTIVAGYLIGARGTAYHATFLGAVVTLTHTFGVFALGLVTLYGSHYILPERLYPWLSFFSGLSIVIIGISMFRKRFLALHHKHDHSHSSHDHDHNHHHDHSHLPVDERGTITWRSLITVGISGGALPCPSALVVLLSAISLHRIGFGLLLIVAFSLGLAFALTSIGLLLVYTSDLIRKFSSHNQILLRMPLASSLVITLLGCAIAIQAIM